MYSLILGIEYVTNLFFGAQKLVSVKKEPAAGLSFFYHKNTGVLTDLFMLSFDQACRMEDYYSSEQVDFLAKKQTPSLFGKFDIVIYLITPVIFLIFWVLA